MLIFCFQISKIQGVLQTCITLFTIRWYIQETNSKKNVCVIFDIFLMVVKAPMFHAKYTHIFEKLNMTKDLNKDLLLTNSFHYKKYLLNCSCRALFTQRGAFWETVLWTHITTVFGVKLVS